MWPLATQTAPGEAADAVPTVIVGARIGRLRTRRHGEPDDADAQDYSSHLLLHRESVDGAENERCSTRFKPVGTRILPSQE